MQVPRKMVINLGKKKKKKQSTLKKKTVTYRPRHSTCFEFYELKECINIFALLNQGFHHINQASPHQSRFTTLTAHR